MKKMNYFIFSIICLFSCNIVFAQNEVIIKSITPVYDENSGITVNEENGDHSVIFNDRNQSIRYNIVLENTTDKEYTIEAINFSHISDNYFSYEVGGLKDKDVIEANSDKEVFVSLETINGENWGRNFNTNFVAEVILDSKVTNPNTGANSVKLLLISGIALLALLMVIFKKSKRSRIYGILGISFFAVIPLINAKNDINLPIKINVSFDSQNVMKANNCKLEQPQENTEIISSCEDYWQYSDRISRIYIQNQTIEIENYVHRFDVSEKKDGRVTAYLIENTDTICYDSSWNQIKCYSLYLQADGIIYLNSNSSFFFAGMTQLTQIDNIKGIDTSNVTDMSYMFYKTASNYIEDFELDLSNFNTSKVTDMNSMFKESLTYINSDVLDLSSFDTSNVTDMQSMFENTGFNANKMTINLGEFDTSSVVNMSKMFKYTLYNSVKTNTTITIRNPNTSSYDMMFNNAATKTGAQITVNCTSRTSNLVDKMIATKSTNSNVIKADFSMDVSSFSVGDEIHISNEKFNIISQTEDTITMLAKYNIQKYNHDSDESKQANNNSTISFSSYNGWEYNSGPKEIDIQQFDGYTKQLINGYVKYLKQETGMQNVTGTLITLKELKNLGCTINDDYSYSSGLTCANSQHISWIQKNMNSSFWTRSAVLNEESSIWVVSGQNLEKFHYSSLYIVAVRPVITISKEEFKKYVSSET